MSDDKKPGLIGRWFGGGREAPDTRESPVEPEVPAAIERPSWFQRLTSGMSRSSQAIGGGIVSIFTKRKLDADTLEELEDVLIQADLGVTVSSAIAERLSAERYGKDITDHEVKTILAAEVEQVLAPVAVPFALKADKLPQVVLVVGVNGSGKTTTIGKLASKFTSEGKTVMLAAGDTFRAAAGQQLGIWGERTGADVVQGQDGGDPSSVIFDAVQRAAARGADLVMADTAGRIHTKSNLMEELRKVRRVADRDPGDVTEVLLVLDATTGQNGLAQARQFTEAVEVTGVVLTKLDGSARGGIVIAIQDDLGIPVKLVGLGEQAEDLIVFDPHEFVDALFEG